jgi:hypothetical protein
VDSLQFETSDLFEAKNLQQVLQHIGALHVYVSRHVGTLKEKAEKAGSGKLGSAKKASSTKTPLDPSMKAKSTTTLRAGSPVGSPSSSATHEHVSSTGSPSRPKTPSVASLAADIATKEEFKYNPEVEAAAQRWIEKVLDLPPNAGLSFYQFLKSGVVLCNLGNKIQPAILPHIYEGSLPYRQMENIGWYIKACQQLGMRDEELFETADLFSERNLNAVANHIHVLAHWLTKRPEGHEWTGPLIEDVRTAKSLFSATLVEPNWDKISSTSAILPLTDDQKDLLAWANSKLANTFSYPPIIIENLSNDLKNGLKLIHLLSAISRGQSIGIYNTEPSLIWHAMQNASAILSFVASQTFEKVDGVRAVDIVTGNVSAISRLLFYLREKFDLDYLFAKTLGTLSSEHSSTTGPSTPTHETSDTMEVEIMEGEEVPAHLRPLMSPEDLQFYDRLARERIEDEARERDLLHQHQPSNVSNIQSEVLITNDHMAYTINAGHTSPKHHPSTTTHQETSHSPTSKNLVPQVISTASTSEATLVTANTTRVSPILPHTALEVELLTTTTTTTTITTQDEIVLDMDHDVEIVEDEFSIAAGKVKALSGVDQQETRSTRKHSQSTPKKNSTTTTDHSTNNESTSTPEKDHSSKTSGDADSPTVGKRHREGKKDRSKDRDGSSGTSSPKLKDSSDAIEGNKTRSKPKTKRDKSAPDTVAAPNFPSGTSPNSTVTSESSIGSASQREDDAVSRISSGSSTPTLPDGTFGISQNFTRQHSHSRERSIPRRVNVKRTATFGAGNLVVVTDQDKVLRAQQVVRKHVALETLTTEQSYLNSLKTLIRELLEPVKRSKVLSIEEFNSLFSNIESIANYHVRFESLLKERIGSWEDTSVVSDIFLKETGFFIQYGSYLQNYNKATVAMHYLRKKYPKFDQFIKNFEDELMKTSMQTVDSFLIMPVQRLPRYRLLLSDMRKYTPPSLQEFLDLEAAIKQVDEVVRELNSHIPKDGAEQIRKMLSIESSIQQGKDDSVAIMKLDRKFVKEGALLIKKLKVGDKTKPEKKKMIERMKGLKAYVFLLNDLLLVCEQLKSAKSDDKCQFGLVHAYNLNDVLVMSEKERSERSLDQIANFTIKHVDKKAKETIFYIHAESDLVIIHTSSSEERDSWVHSLTHRSD